MKSVFLIVSYNDFASLNDLINNIIFYKVIDEILIVDNNSKLEEKEKIKSIGSNKVNIIFNEVNKGYSYAINIGVKYLIDKYKKCNVFISNADIIIKKEKDLEELLKIKDGDFNVGIVVPVINEHGNLNRGWKLTKPNIDLLFLLPKVYSKFEKKYRYYANDYYDKKINKIDVASGCFFLTSTDVLEKVNFLDENVFLYYEENILAKKLQNINLKTVIANEIEIIHNHSITINKNIKQKKKMIILKKSMLYYEKKYNNAKGIVYFTMKILAWLSYLFIKE